MKFCWNEEKSRKNYEKHDLRFDEAQVIWSDEHALEFFDPDHSETENRFIRLGLNPVRGILLVVFCERENGIVIRIISARKASLMERREYEREL